MGIKNGIKLILDGNINVAQKFVGTAKKGMAILENLMSFQNLSQNNLSRWINEDVFIKCTKVYNYQECYIWAKPKDEEIKKLLTGIEKEIIAVVSTFTGNKAFAWNVTRNELLFDIMPFSELSSKMENSKYQTKNGTYKQEFTPLQKLEHDGTFAFQRNDTPMPGTLSPPRSSLYGHTVPNINPISFYNTGSWNIDEYFDWALENGVNDSLESVDVGNYFHIFAEAFKNVDTNNEWEPGDYIKFTTHKASTDITSMQKSSLGSFDWGLITGSMIGSIDENWTITVFRVPGIPINHINVSGEFLGNIYDSGGGSTASHVLTDIDNDKDFVAWRPYFPTENINYIEDPDIGIESRISNYFIRTSDAFSKLYWENDFASLSGYSWPSPLEGEDPNDYIMRERVFYNHVFGNQEHFNFVVNGSSAGFYYKIGYKNFYDSFLDGDWSSPGKVGAYDSATGDFIIEDRTDYAANRYKITQVIGRSPTSNSVDTEPAGSLVFDAGRFQTRNETEYTVGLFYKEKNALGFLEKKIWEKVNLKRTNRGLSTLVYNKQLQDAADRYARDEGLELGLIDESWDKHRGIEGETPFHRIYDAGYCRYWSARKVWIGENIFLTYQTDPFLDIESYSSFIVDGWMSSPTHRTVILTEELTETGLAVYKLPNRDNAYSIVQTFGEKDDAWPGYSSLDMEKMQTYMENNFTKNDIMQDVEFLKVYASEKEIETLNVRL